MKDESYLINLLFEVGVTPEQVRLAKQQAGQTGASVIDTLVSEHVITPEQVLAAKAKHFGLEFRSLKGLQIPLNVIGLVPEHIARRYRVVPVELKNDVLVVAVSDPADIDTMDSLAHLLHGKLEFCVASEEHIGLILSACYANGQALPSAQAPMPGETNGSKLTIVLDLIVPKFPSPDTGTTFEIGHISDPNVTILKDDKLVAMGHLFVAERTNRLSVMVDLLVSPPPAKQ